MEIESSLQSAFNTVQTTKIGRSLLAEMPKDLKIGLMDADVAVQKGLPAHWMAFADADVRSILLRREDDLVREQHKKYGDMTEQTLVHEMNHIAQTSRGIHYNCFESHSPADLFISHRFLEMESLMMECAYLYERRLKTKQLPALYDVYKQLKSTVSIPAFANGLFVMRLLTGMELMPAAVSERHTLFEKFGFNRPEAGFGCVDEIPYDCMKEAWTQYMYTRYHVMNEMTDEAYRLAYRNPIVEQKMIQLKQFYSRCRD